MASIDQERFVLDILAPKFDFQMIRPVVVPPAGSRLRPQSYDLDSHAYSGTYAIKNIGSGWVEFQASLNKKAEGGPHLLQQVCY